MGRESEQHESENDAVIDGSSGDALRSLLQSALKDLEDARLNSTMFEEKAQKISETAIFLRDEAAEARRDADSVTEIVLQLTTEESGAMEAIQKAENVVSFAEAQVKLAVEALQKARERGEGKGQYLVADALANEFEIIENADGEPAHLPGEIASQTLDLRRPYKLNDSEAAGALVEDEEGGEANWFKR